MPSEVEKAPPDSSEEEKKSPEGADNRGRQTLMPPMFDEVDYRTIVTLMNCLLNRITIHYTIPKFQCINNKNLLHVGGAGPVFHMVL